MKINTILKLIHYAMKEGDEASAQSLLQSFISSTNKSTPKEEDGKEEKGKEERVKEDIDEVYPPCEVCRHSADAVICTNCHAFNSFEPRNCKSCKEGELSPLLSRCNSCTNYSHYVKKD